MNRSIDDFAIALKNQPLYLRETALAIARQLITEGLDENIAMQTGITRARQYFNAIALDEIPSSAEKTGSVPGLSMR